MSLSRLSKVLLGASAAGLTCLAYTKWQEEQTKPLLLFQPDAKTPSRAEQVASLAHCTLESPYDVLIIGGGATGAGIAVDATTRGLRTAMLEKGDFGGQTSSKSTKLVHGGVRYLEKAVFNLDYGQLKLVFEALHERKHLIENAPHLSQSLPIMTPLYRWWEVPFYWTGLKVYDAVAGTQGLTLSRYTSPKESKRQFPTLAQHGPDNRRLLGTIVYYDGQFDDARLNVTLAISASQAGATTLNYAEVTKLLKDSEGQVIGASVRDSIGNKTYDVYARQVVNATGPFVDNIRKLSEPKAETMVTPSAGVHITLPDYYSPENLGMIVPKTKDGRVVFMLPWKEATIAGTTDRPQAHEDEVNFILDAISEYLTVKVRRSDVLSTWAGLRPLATDPNASNTESASRDHIVTRDSDGLLTVTGGKWTTYRRMAQDAVDEIVGTGRVKPIGECCTVRMPLVGAQGYTPALFTEVAQNYIVPHRPGAIDTNVAKHLATSYGDRAHMVTKIAEERKLGRRLVRGHPMLEAEVVYAAQNEYCETIEDFIARRTRLAFLDVNATKEALPRIAVLMAKEKGWWIGRAKRELENARQFLRTFEPEAATSTPIKAAETPSSI